MDTKGSLRSLKRCTAKRIIQVAVFFVLLFQFQFTTPIFAAFCVGDDVVSVGCKSVSDPGVVQSGGSKFRHVGNPIDVISGNKQQHELDYQAVGSPLHFSRYYHSAQTDNNVSLGQGWRHSYFVRLYKVDGEHYRVQQGDGRWINFTLATQGASQSIFNATFEGDGYLVVKDNVVWNLPDDRAMHFQGSYLTRVEYPHGVNLHLFYKNRKLISVSDRRGRELQFEYSIGRSGLADYQQSQQGEHKGHLSAIRLPSGQRIKYLYDANRNLVRVSYPETVREAKVEGGTDYAGSRVADLGSSTGVGKLGRRYEFLNDVYPNHLTSIINTSSRGRDERTWKYDSDGRVVQFEHAAKKLSMSLLYEQGLSGANSGVTIVEYGHGRQEQYSWVGEPTTGHTFVSDVVLTDCVDCQSIQLLPVARKKQVPSQVGARENQTLSGPQQINLQKNNSADVGSFGVFPQLDEFVPSPVSFDQRTQITIDGTNYSLLVEVSRRGDVDDISVGSTSLSELKDKWGQGKIEKCETQPRLQRSRVYPSPEKGCLEDLIYLVELTRHIERLSFQVGPKKPMPTHRSGSAKNEQESCLQNPFQSCSELERDFQLAQLSSCAYRSVVQLCGERWQAVSPSLLGLDEALFNDGSFSATLFYNPETGEYILAFRGTDNLGDWKDNFIQASGGSSKQYGNAVVLASALDQALPPDSLSFTGHSLGGGLATAAALSVDAPATVFNPAALHPDTATSLGLDYESAQKLVSVTTVDGDLLTAIQQPTEDDSSSFGRFPAPGKHTVLAAPSDDWIDEEKKDYPFLARSDGVVLHSIDAVMETEENMLVEFCGKTPS